MTVSSPSKSKSYSLKTRLIAGVALGVFAFGGAGMTLPLMMSPALAESAVETMPSFADLVQKVRPAVVSVKVKVEQGASNVDPEEFGFPDLPPGHPLEKFFKQFRDQGHKNGP